MSIKGISGKSVACLLLYRMGRVDFAVDRDHDLHRISASLTQDGGRFPNRCMARWWMAT